MPEPGQVVTVDDRTRPHRRLVRAWSAPLLVHAALLGGILSLLVIVVGDEGVFSSDEGAGIIQAQVVSHGQWGMEQPLPTIDSTGRWFPLEKSAPTKARDGFAPLPKKPAYSWLGAQLWPFGGARSLMALSALATVVAALLVALITRELDPRLDRAALWMAGLASPLLADGLLVIAHTMAAAAVAAALLGVFRWHRTGRSGWAALVVLAAAAATLVRAEAALVAAGMVGALLVLAVLRREARLIASAAMVLGGGALGFAIDMAWTRRLFGVSTGSGPAGSSAAGSFLDDRVSAFVTTWLRPGYGAVGVAQLLGILIVLLGIVVVFLARRGEQATVLRALCIAVAVLAGARVVFRSPDPDVVPGLLVAFPLLVWGLTGLRRDTVRSREAAVGGLAFALFAAAVLATQYRQGGAWEWGGRYFAAGLPLIMPLVVVGGRDALRRFDVSVRSIALAAVVTVALSAAVMQVLAVRYSHLRGHDLVEHALALAERTPPGDGGLPVLISTEPELPRSAWAELDEARWLYVPLGEVGDVMERLAAVHIDQVVIATHEGPDAVRAIPQMRERSVGEVPPPGTWWFRVVAVR